MLTIDDFAIKYETYSDEELYHIHKNQDQYSEDAGRALDRVIAKKGGIELLVKRIEAKVIVANEKKRIGDEAAFLGRNAVDAAFLKRTTASSIFTAAEVEDIIKINVEKGEAQAKDTKVNSETIFKSLLGFGLAVLAGGAFASLQFIYFGATSFILIAGMAIICYGIVKLVTKKSYNNLAVLIASVLAFIFSYLIGYLAFLVFGYWG